MLAEQALPDAERPFGLVQQLARSITKRIGWIAYDPAQRVALRPTDRFRDRAIGLIRGAWALVVERGVTGAVSRLRRKWRRRPN
ncbi:hypothetical protein GS440_03665 [Rhodococcus hoagii]|nr:hypothetical protein [Prescottella equi]